MSTTKMGSEIRNILKTCSICQQTFPSIRELIAHEKSHDVSSSGNSSSGASSSNKIPKFTPYRSSSFVQCEFCKAMISSRGNYLAHKREFHVHDEHNRLLLETVNPKMRKLRRPLTYEETTQLDLGILHHFACDYCHEKFTSKVQFLAHVKKAHTQSQTASRMEEELDEEEPEMEESGDDVRGDLLNKTTALMKERSGLESNSGLRFMIGINAGGAAASDEFLATSMKPGPLYSINTDQRCEYCFGLFSNAWTIREHQQRYHFTASGDAIYFCAKCSILRKGYRGRRSYKDTPSFPNEEMLLAHISNVHGDESTSKSNGLGILDSGKSATVSCRDTPKAMTNESTESSERDANVKDTAWSAWSTTVKQEPEESTGSSTATATDTGHTSRWIRPKEEIVDPEYDSVI